MFKRLVIYFSMNGLLYFWLLGLFTNVEVIDKLHEELPVFLFLVLIPIFVIGVRYLISGLELNDRKRFVYTLIGAQVFFFVSALLLETNGVNHFITNTNTVEW